MAKHAKGKTSKVIYEAIIIFLSAILGTFTWNHGSMIFNGNHPSQWLKALGHDMTTFWLAWSFFGVLLFALLIVLWLRIRGERDT